MVMSHVLEKGITMPNRRLGFGKERVKELIVFLNEVIQLHGEDHVEIQSALKDLEQYKNIHDECNFSLSPEISQGIEKLLLHKAYNTKECFETTSEQYFKQCDNFCDFAKQRHSVRWYSEEPVQLEKIIKAIELSQTAPSACNRQGVKTYIISTNDKKEKVLDIQNGNRGWGHLADKILLVTADMKCWSPLTRTSAFIDAGIFVQNLLYSLHYYKILACTLNAHLDKKDRKRLREIVEYTASEIPVVFISIGNAPDKFMIAGSQRLNTEEIYKVI